MSVQTTIIPHNQTPLVSRTYPSESELNVIIKTAAEAQNEWAKTPLTQRIAIGRKFLAST